MPPPAATMGPGTLCRAEHERMRPWIMGPASVRQSLGWIVLSGALYGATMGVWRDALLGVYVAIKLPILLIVTASLTAVINGWLAQLLGLRLPVSRSFAIVLATFALLGVILASLSPLIAFVVWNVPGQADPNAWTGHDVLGLLHITVIAFAGVVANLKLHGLLSAWSARAARKVLIAWLATNLFLGAQLSWNLRPFFGSPGMPVEFLRADALNGTFYESTFSMFHNLITNDSEESSNE